MRFGDIADIELLGFALVPKALFDRGTGNLDPKQLRQGFLYIGRGEGSKYRIIFRTFFHKSTRTRERAEQQLVVRLCAAREKPHPNQH